MATPITPVILPPHPVANSRLYSFDFGEYPELATEGLTLASAAVTVNPPTGLTPGSVVVSGTQAQFRIPNSQTPGSYILTLIGVTSAGDDLAAYLALDIDPAPTP